MKKRNLATLIMSLVFFTLVFTGCNSAKNNASTEESFDTSEGLVYDHSMEVKYAKLFTVDYYKGDYKMITIKNRDEDTAVVSKETKILLVPQGKDTPSDLSDDTIVLNTPVTNMLVSSTPVVALMNSSGCLDNISKVTADKESWYIDEVKNAFDEEKIKYVGSSKEIDYEALVADTPTISVFTTMLSTTPEVSEKLKELNIKYIIDQSAYEDDPLGRVEWAKLYGAMCNKEDIAKQMFDEQAAFVDSLANVEKSDKSIAVFYISSNGKIYVRNSDDYIAKMVSLAGGNYIYSNLNPGKTGTQIVSAEEFYATAKDADYIIYIWSIGGKPQTLENFVGYNPILEDFKAVKDKNVWCTTPDYFQLTNKIGNMVNDINLMMNADENTDSLTYLNKLK